LILSGIITRQEFEQEFTRAARVSGQDDGTIASTIKSAIEAGLRDSTHKPRINGHNRRDNLIISIIPEDSEFKWSDPIPLGSSSPPEISTDLLPGCFAEYAQNVSENTQTPPDMSVMLIYSVLATCGQRFGVVKPTLLSEYFEPLPIWTITVMNPGNRKTEVFKLITSPLYQWEKQKREELRNELHKNKSIRSSMERAVKDKRRQLAKLEGEELENALNEISEMESKIPAEIHPPILSVSNITPERLENLLVEQNEKMAVLGDEGGIFQVISGLYNSGHSNYDVFLAGHSGSKVRVERAGRTAYLDSPNITLGLTIQEEVLKRMVDGSMSSFKGKGGIGRCLFCIPESLLGKRDLRKVVNIDEDLKRKYEDA
jgi:hypothetical protein